MNLILSLPPSVNNYLMPVVRYSKGKAYSQNIKTPEVRTWEQINIPIVKEEIKKQKWKIPEEGKFIDIKIDYFFPRKGNDPGNYPKVLLDVFTQAGLYIDDQWAKPQTGIVIIDKFNPRLEIEISLNDQYGVFKSKEKRDEFIIRYKNQMPKRSFDALIKRLDEGRLTEKVYLDRNNNVLILNEHLKSL